MGRLVALELPPGVVKNGTEYEARGRWYDVDKVRWRNGRLRPIGGQRPFYDTSGVAITISQIGDGLRVNSGLAWTDNSGNRWALFGAPGEIDVLENDGTKTDVDPGGYTPVYEATRTSLVSGWSMHTFGEIPIVCNDADGRILEWDLNTANNFVAVTNAPTSCVFSLVTAERFVMAFGAGGEPRRIEWSDRENRTVWTPATTNQAGGYDLETEGEIMLALQMRGEILVVTTADCWRGTYVGYPEVYAFERIGQCSCISRRGGVRAGDAAYWVGDRAIYEYSAGSVRELPCDVIDFFFDDLRETGSDPLIRQGSLINAWHNSTFGEVWFFYMRDIGLTPQEAYVAYNYREGWWAVGHTTIQFALDVGAYPLPIGVQANTSGLVTNGAFSSDTAWTKGTNWRIAGGVADQSTPTISTLSQVVSGITNGVHYVVEFSVLNRTTGELGVSFGTAGNSVGSSANGTQRGVLIADDSATDGTATLSFTTSGGWDGDLDNVVLYAVPVVLLETGHRLPNPQPYAETGPLELGNGERRVHVTRVLPDEQDAGELKLTFKHREYPTSSETTETTVTAANPTDVRFSGRQITLRVTGTSSNADWRSGVHRLEVAAGGER